MMWEEIVRAVTFLLGQGVLEKEGKELMHNISKSCLHLAIRKNTIVIFISGERPVLRG